MTESERHKIWKKNNIKTRKIDFYLSNEEDKTLYEFTKTLNFQKFVKDALKEQTK